MSTAEIVRIVHISDTHISEGFDDLTLHKIELPDRAGHDRSALLALDRFLTSRSNPWDVLLVSGDVTRVGDPRSFANAHNWLHTRQNILPNVGLGLGRKDGIVVVPGNHDRFSGNKVLGQTSTENDYNKWFGAPDRTVCIDSRGVEVRVHCFDSSYPKGGWAKGYVDPVRIQGASCQDTGIDIAMLHHHPIQPPNLPRDRKTELYNGTQVASVLLGGAFHVIAFGHTHQSDLRMHDVRALVGLVSDRRARGRVSQALCRLPFVRNFTANDSLLTDYKRVIVNNKLVDYGMQFRYLFLRDRVKPPELITAESFKTVEAFYRHIERVEDLCRARGNPIFSTFESAPMRRRKLISMAPSACQVEAQRFGFHQFNVHVESGVPRKVETQRFHLVGEQFVATVEGPKRWCFA